MTVLSLGLFVGLLDPLPLHASPTTIAAFTYDPCVPCVPPGDLVLFNPNSSLALTGTIVSYTWDFGDGTGSHGEVVTHAYTASEAYRIVLTLSTSSGNPSISQTIIVAPIQSVGGVIALVDKLGPLFPYLILASAVAATILAGLYLRRGTIKRQRGTSRQC